MMCFKVIEKGCFSLWWLDGHQRFYQCASRASATSRLISTWILVPSASQGHSPSIVNKKSTRTSSSATFRYGLFTPYGAACPCPVSCCCISISVFACWLTLLVVAQCENSLAKIDWSIVFYSFALCFAELGVASFPSPRWYICTARDAHAHPAQNSSLVPGVADNIGLYEMTLVAL